jgi:hypothetical protein
MNCLIGLMRNDAVVGSAFDPTKNFPLPDIENNAKVWNVFRVVMCNNGSNFLISHQLFFMDDSQKTIMILCDATH